MPVMVHTQLKQWGLKNLISPVITPVLVLPATRYIQTAAKCVITMNTAVAVKNQVIIVIAVTYLMFSLLGVLALEVLEVGGRTGMKAPGLAWKYGRLGVLPGFPTAYQNGKSTVFIVPGR